MKNAIHYSLFALVMGLCSAQGSPVLAQQKPQPGSRPATTTTAAPSPSTPQQTSDVERISIRRVLLPITVLDKKGQLVMGLTASDFQVFEDKMPQAIDSFTGALESPPLNVGVLMDTSPSTAGKIKFEQESAMNFIQTVIKPRKDRVAFVTFDDEIKLRQDFTDRLDQLDKAVYSVKKPGKQTALYDAIWQFCDEKMRSAQGRRALVIITDGDDTYSRANLRDAIDIAQRTETTIFAISTKAGFAGVVPGVEAGTVQDSGDKDLVKLCEETGGAAFFTGDMLALERSFTKINKELHTQYIVTYKPKNDRYDGSYRRIEVRLAGEHDGMKIRTRRGYSAVADNVKP
jgi:Ca-activated chloride channel family protein